MIRTRPPGSPITWRWFHDNTELEWQTDDLTDLAPTLLQTQAYASLGTPVVCILNRNDRTELQFHGLGASTLATVESGIGDAASPPPSGTVNSAFVYSPFGEVLEASGADAVSHRRRMNDKVQDTHTGLLYYGARHFDPVAATWLQHDPTYAMRPDSAGIAPRRALLYTMALNNPLRYVDPDGRSPNTIKAYHADLTKRSNLDETVKLLQTAIKTMRSGPLAHVLERHGHSIGKVSSVRNLGTPNQATRSSGSL